MYTEHSCQFNAQPPLALEIQFRFEATVMHLFCAHTDVQAFNKSPLRQLYSILSRALKQLPTPCSFFVSSHNKLHLVRLHCRAVCSHKIKLLPFLTLLQCRAGTITCQPDLC